MGEPVRPTAEEGLARRVRALREALERSGANTEGMVAALGSFGNRVSAIDADVRPAQVRMHTLHMANENIDRTIEVAEDILVQLDIARRAEATISKGPQEDIERYLEAMDQLKGIIRFFSSHANSKSCEGLLNHVNGLLTHAALMIEDEFRQLMGTYSKPIEPDCLFDCLPKLICTSNGAPEAVEEQPSNSSDLYQNPTLIPQKTLPLLHDMAHQLVQNGNQQSCYTIYRLFVDRRPMNIEKELNKGDVQRMQWEHLKTKIGNWNQFMQIAVKVLLAGERKNCDLVFDGIAFDKDQCFAELAGVSFLTLLSFGDAVAKSKMSPEKLSLLLDMYEVMHGLQSEVEVIFQGRFCREMHEAAFNLTKSLAQTAQEALVDFVEAVEKDTENTIQDGNVHPLTIQVINCAKPLLGYQSTLEILKPFETGSATESQVTVVTRKILQALQNNLDGRFNLYKDSALGYIFLMNNIQYMVMFVCRSEAKDILGNDWIQMHRRIVQKNSTHYRRVAWKKILDTLSVPAASGTGSSASELSDTGVSRTMIKERFRSFNKKFEEIRTTQSQWNIPDKELQADLRLAVAELVVPAYRSFVTRFGYAN
ncbi:hypothetical protein QOZ80_5AG0382260 [Eleusine coracana subsp. coracana]|nr:hypothetical protein QOZ80_5AG0382260 [Eleusine coracana subsp. coracana]